MSLHKSNLKTSRSLIHKAVTVLTPHNNIITIQSYVKLIGILVVSVWLARTPWFHDIFVCKFKLTTGTVSRLHGCAEKYPKSVTITTGCSKSQQLISDTSDRSSLTAPVALCCKEHVAASEVSLTHVVNYRNLVHSTFHSSPHSAFYILYYLDSTEEKFASPVTKWFL